MPHRNFLNHLSVGSGEYKASRTSKLKRQFPTVEDLRKYAERRVPAIGYDTVAGGVGQDLGVKRNADALDAIEIVPRVGADRGPVGTSIELFGQDYAAPIGVAPMGLQSLFWPGAERLLARSAQRLRIPYASSMVSGISLEEAAELAPDVIWFQIFRIARDDFKIGFDLLRRAQAVGVRTLVVTLDTPVRAKRPGELRNGLALPFRPTVKTIAHAIMSPQWLAALIRNGQPSFPCLAPYCSANASKAEIAQFAQNEIDGALTWAELRRYRDAWKGSMVIKGVMHPADAEMAVSLGMDGVQISNHGGRQLEAAPSVADVLPAIARVVAGKIRILCDGGVRSGLDVVRLLALGADAAFSGRSFLYGLGAIGEKGADYVSEMLVEEISIAMRQLGASDITALRELKTKHPGAISF